MTHQLLHNTLKSPELLQVAINEVLILIMELFSLNQNCEPAMPALSTQIVPIRACPRDLYLAARFSTRHGPARSPFCPKYKARRHFRKSHENFHSNFPENEKDLAKDFGCRQTASQQKLKWQKTYRWGSSLTGGIKG